MARQLTAEDIANLIDQPDWDNSDAKSNEDNGYFPLSFRDPLQWARNSEDSDDESDHTQQTVHAGSFPPQ